MTFVTIWRLSPYCMTFVAFWRLSPIMTYVAYRVCRSIVLWEKIKVNFWDSVMFAADRVAECSDISRKL